MKNKRLKNTVIVPTFCYVFGDLLILHLTGKEIQPTYFSLQFTIATFNINNLL